jgi:hypothetical protein
MPRVIHKQILKEVRRQTIEVPFGSEILHVDEQKGKLCIWYACNSLDRLERVGIAIVGTGEEFPEYVATFNHIDTVVMNCQTFVWHIFNCPAEGA